MFVTRLREIRKQRKIKASEVAEYLGVTRSTYGSWENRGSEPSYEMLIKIADYFHVSTDYLLYRKDVDKTEEPNENNERIPVLTYEHHKKPAYSDQYGWVLVDYQKNSCVDVNGQFIPFEKVGNLYTGIPDSLLSTAKFERPLTMEEMSIRSEPCWVQPLSNDPTLNDMLKGWYKPQEKGVVGKNGFRFPYATYNVQWVAFRNKK